MDEKKQSDVPKNALENRVLEWNTLVLQDRSLLGKLFIANFGPLKQLEIDVKRLTLVIGKNNAGKSVLARLLSILLESVRTQKTEEQIRNSFIENEISFIEKETTIILISKLGKIFISDALIISNSNFEKNNNSLNETMNKLKFHYPVETLFEDVKYRKNLNKFKREKPEDFNFLKNFLAEAKKVNKTIFQLLPIYIPSERALISLLSGSLYSLMNAKINLPKSITDFGANYELSRKRVKRLKSQILDDIEYQYKNGEDFIFYDQKNYIPLANASSSIQSTTPLQIVLEYFGKDKNSNILVEEPETNLFPSAQKAMAEYLSLFCQGSMLQTLFVTTHSPYILSAFNNIILAGTLAEQKPELHDEINNIIPQASWVTFDNTSAYILENGAARLILDEEWGGVLAEDIDQTSDEIGNDYDQLLELKYKDKA